MKSILICVLWIVAWTAGPLCCSSCSIPQNQAVLQDVANEIGIQLPVSATGSRGMMLGAPSITETPSMKKNNNFYGQ